ncbi:MAG: hypothetical protein CUN49_01725 [Candidatus Thermofonsia Clade 1 bacterium]|uniref:Protein kinase domain-containing protein n=1 Tax=Candidatus Thermofonsia Clade 1 bacterium TaxID=2364210 RepID=A0A2M8PHY7_9CHLR|nr:MAG: hypothetical protein CUN49_01725 [Candidatus Thermofonsia Clade 1 bacterium]
MPRPVTGRRPDSLFDNRYRYDHIYPRGRSGETLRAYDTHNGDRPCVIKRPALQDAPPIRAGQEVSILNEKRALEQLSGHPVLCELLHSGTFRIGGHQHQYIVIEMASGETLETLTLALAAQGERLPDLELLIILEGVLDLLQAAHDKRIVYNDVDAKHIFWDREAYQLKMIDWGNAVFLDSDSHSHVTRHSDIAQVGQLLYFLLSGGRCLDLSRPEAVNDLPESVPPRLKATISRAISLDPATRYANIAELRRDLAEVRRPLQKQREALIERVRSRLPHVNSQSQLAELRQWLLEARRADPGYPPARELEAEVERRLSKLQLQADLDAMRIYLESGNFARATELLDDLLLRSSEELQPTLRFLQDACELLAHYAPLQPEGFSQVLDALLSDDPQAAARLLLTTPDPRDAARQLQLLLAERLCAYLPIVVLLRPHLARLEALLKDTAHAASVRQIVARFEETPAQGIQNLLRHYQRVADALAMLEGDLRGMTGALESLRRALQAAEALIDLIEVAAQNALSDPSRAGNALWHAQAIDPTSGAFAPLNALLNAFHADLEALRNHTPATDGRDIADFLGSAAQRLAPYAAEITDPRFQAILRDLDAAAKAWLRVADAIALGGKRPAVDQCKAAAVAIRSLSPKTAYWFEEYARRLEEAPRVEFLSPNLPLGRALAEGWESWDRGRTAEALHSGKRAADYALTEAERLAARRLIGLSEALDTWLERDGATSTPQTEAALRRVNALFLPEEETLRQTFAAQMPSMQTYLKAMSKGVVEPLRDSSAAGVRVLFFDYVLRGILALQREQFDEANLWKEAAAKALPNARNHPAFQTLETAIVRQQLILEAVRTLNNLTSVSAIAEARQAVRAPLAATQLESADLAVRALEDALRRWHDGDFRAARSQLDLALERAVGAEIALNKPLANFKAWLQLLADSAEYLAQQRRLIEEEALAPSETPKPEIAEAHQKLVDITRRDLGEPYTAQLRQWRDTYLAVRDLYTDPKLTKDEKLRLFEGHFASLFIDRQPALPILRYWRTLIERLPDPEPELPRYQSLSDALEPSGAPDLDALEAAPAPRRQPRPEPLNAPAPTEVPPLERRSERTADRERLQLLLIGAFGVLAIIAGLLLLFSNGSADLLPTPSATPAGLGAPLNQAPTVVPPTLTPTFTATLTPTFTLTPSQTFTPEALVPSPTPLPTGELLSPATLLAALSPSPIPTLSAGASPEPTNPAIALPTLPPDARSGEYDMLAALLALDEKRRTWDSTWFSYQEGAWIVGNPTRTSGRAPLIRFGPELLTPLFGAEAARYLQRMEIELELVSYEPRLLPTGQVIFGAGMESLQGQRAAVEARLIQEQIANFGINLNGNFLQKTQLPAKPLILRAAVARGADRTLSLFLDGQLLGQSNAAYAPDMPISLYVYTATGGMIVKINAWRVWLQKPE